MRFYEKWAKIYTAKVIICQVKFLLFYLDCHTDSELLRNSIFIISDFALAKSNPCDILL